MFRDYLILLYALISNNQVAPPSRRKETYLVAIFPHDFIYRSKCFYKQAECSFLVQRISLLFSYSTQFPTGTVFEASIKKDYEQQEAI